MKRGDALKVMALVLLGLATFATVYTLRTVLRPLPPIFFVFRGVKFIGGDHLSARITYSTTQPCTAFFLAQDGSVVASAVLSPENVTAELRLTEGLETLRADFYALRIVYGDNVLFENHYVRPLVIASILVERWGWDPRENKSTITDLKLTVKNKGDLPVYAERAATYAGGILIGEFKVGRWVFPEIPLELSYSLWSPTLEPYMLKTTVDVFDIENLIIERPPRIVAVGWIAPPDFPFRYWERVESWQAEIENRVGLETWESTIRAPGGWEAAVRWWVGGGG
jgi:hypothetical protein